jgi:hypothetical protein
VQQTHARHILIKVTPTMSAAEAKRKLLELKERLDNKAAKFEDLARWSRTTVRPPRAATWAGCIRATPCRNSNGHER